MQGIDLNSDVGESFGRWTLGNDAALFEYISSANIACGYHAGDPTIIRETARLAVEHNVVIGAHPSYRDRAGFGRRFIEVPPIELTNDIVTQIGILQTLARIEGGEVRYVKPHGALYNAIVEHEAQAQAVVDAIRTVDLDLPLVVPPFSAVRRLAEQAGLRTVVEAFADRSYTREGALVPRSQQGSVIEDTAAVVEQVLRIVDGHVVAIDGSRVRLDADTICLHGDTPGAVELSAEIAESLSRAGIETRSFVQ